MNQDLKDKTVSELNKTIIALKSKHYKEGLTLIERKQYWKAKALYEQKVQNLPQVTPIGSSLNIFIDG